MDAKDKTIYFWNSVVFNRTAALIILIILCIIFVRSCEKSENISRLQNNVDILSKEVTYGKTKLKQVVAVKEALEVTNKELKEQFWIKDDSLKDITRRFNKIQSATIIKSDLRIDSVNIPFITPVDYVFSRPFNLSNPFYSIDGTATNTGLFINSIYANNTQRIVIGTTKGFFNNKLSVNITNSNPNIRTTDILSQSVIIPNKRFGLGPFVGIDYLGRPTFGVALNYSLIRF